MEPPAALLPLPLHRARGGQRPHGGIQHRGQGGARLGRGCQLQRGLRGQKYILIDILNHKKKHFEGEQLQRHQLSERDLEQRAQLRARPLQDHPRPAQ